MMVRPSMRPTVQPAVVVEGILACGIITLNKCKGEGYWGGVRGIGISYGTYKPIYKPILAVTL